MEALASMTVYFCLHLTERSMHAPESTHLDSIDDGAHLHRWFECCCWGERGRFDSKGIAQI